MKLIKIMVIIKKFTVSKLPYAKPLLVRSLINQSYDVSYLK